MVYQDAPYGVLDVEWDKKGWSVVQQREVIDIVLGRAHADSKAGLAWLMWCNVNQVGAFTEVFTSKGFVNTRPIVWHKTNYNTKGPSNELLSTFEICILTYYSKVPKNLYLPKDPWDRHNHIELPTLKKITRHGMGGRVVNPAEKPVQLAQRLMKWHAVSGQSVLIVGSGSGSEIIAAMDMGLNVIAVEQDTYQWAAANDRIQKCAPFMKDYIFGNDPAAMYIDKILEKEFVSHDPADFGEDEIALPTETKEKDGKKRAPSTKLSVTAPSTSEIKCTVCEQGASSEAQFIKCAHCDAMLHKQRPPSAPGSGEGPCGIPCRTSCGARVCTRSCSVKAHGIPVAQNPQEPAQNREIPAENGENAGEIASGQEAATEPNNS